MAILITSPGLVTTGTEGADDISFTGGLTGNGSVVMALAGNDTITMNSDGGLLAAASSTVVGPVIKGQGGADVITLSGIAAVGSATNAEVYGNAGGDTISLDGTFAVVAGGNGSDVVTLNSGTYSAVSLGAGSDILGLDAAASITTGSIAAGAGSDIISGTSLAAGVSVMGGGGADTITLTGGFGGGTGDVINAGAGNDSIVVSGAAILSKINGAMGSDTITVEALASGASIAGAAGADVILLSAVTDASVLGGAGTDSLTISSLINTGEMIGGGGNDTIVIGAGSTFDSLTVQGGAGTDSIKFSGAVSGADFGTLEFGAFTDSTVSAYDTVDITAVTGGEAATVDFAVTSAGVLGSAGASLSTLGDITPGAFLTGVGVTGSVTGGFMTLQVSAGVSTAAGFADQATLLATSGNKGSSVLFETGGNVYLFIQGGASGTSDDLMVEFDGANAATTTGGTITFTTD